MIGDSNTAGEIFRLVDSQRYAVLSTRQDNGHPYASLVAYRAGDDLKQLVFCTLRTTRKFANLEAEGRVALLIDNRSNEMTDLQQAAAVTILGDCSETADDERSYLGDWFLTRHPLLADFVHSPGCAVMKMDIRSGYLVTRFQNVVEMHLPNGNGSDSGDISS